MVGTRKSRRTGATLLSLLNLYQRTVQDPPLSVMITIYKQADLCNN